MFNFKWIFMDFYRFKTWRQKATSLSHLDGPVIGVKEKLSKRRQLRRPIPTVRAMDERGTTFDIDRFHDGASWFDERRQVLQPLGRFQGWIPTVMERRKKMLQKNRKTIGQTEKIFYLIKLLTWYKWAAQKSCKKVQLTMTVFLWKLEFEDTLYPDEGGVRTCITTRATCVGSALRTRTSGS